MVNMIQQAPVSANWLLAVVVVRGSQNIRKRGPTPGLLVAFVPQTNAYRMLRFVWHTAPWGIAYFFPLPSLQHWHKRRHASADGCTEPRVLSRGVLPFGLTGRNNIKTGWYRNVCLMRFLRDRHILCVYPCGMRQPSHIRQRLECVIERSCCCNIRRNDQNQLKKRTSVISDIFAN